MRGCWGRVLIETLWNVNFLTKLIQFHFIFVLIETLWNVNFSATAPLIFPAFGFNRNIVECKFRRLVNHKGSIWF